MTKDGFDGVSRRDVLIGAAGGLAAALSPSAARPADARRDRLRNRVRGPSTARAGRPRQSAASPACSSPTAATSRSPTRRGATRCRCPTKRRSSSSSRRASCRRSIPRPICRASIATIARTARRPRSNLLRRVRADRAAARLARLPAAPPGRARRRSRSSCSPIPQPETEAEVDFIREDLIEALAGDAGEIRPHRRRRHVRRSLALRPLQRDHRHDRPALVEHRRQPRPQFRGARPPLQPRDLSGASSAPTTTPSSTPRRCS